MNSIRTRPKFSESKFFLFFGLAWLLLAVPFILFGINEYRVNSRFENEASKIIGNVISKRIEERWDSKERRNDTYYYVRYIFNVDSLNTLEQEQSLNKESWDKIKEKAPIEIEFLTDRPTYNRISGTASNSGSYAMLIVSSIVVLVGSVFIVIYIKKRLYLSRILKNGLETIGTILSIEGSSLTINNVNQLNLNYTFKDRTGRDFSGTCKHINPRLIKDITIGASCKIGYDKDNPNNNILLSV